MKQTFMIQSMGLYVHWPFCLKKCPYCDFNSYAFEYEPEIWVRTLIEEMRLAALAFPGYEIETIFFGGGTPSLIPPHYIKELIDTAFALWPVSRGRKKTDVEITLETNPSTIETHALEQFMASGINRFSIGMQSLNDDSLQFLGRLHSAQEAITILTHAAKICDNVSADFIYSLPKDTLNSWQIDLDKILNLADTTRIKHLSLYQLTIEDGTAFKQQVETKLWSPMDEDKQSDLYIHTYNTLVDAGWDYYEISNAARMIGDYDRSAKHVPRETMGTKFESNVPRGTLGFKPAHELCDTENTCVDTNTEHIVPRGTIAETLANPEASLYRSQHNLIYWQYRPYLGIGPGAHSRMISSNGENRIKFNNTKNPYKWIEQIKASNTHADNAFLDNKTDFEELNGQTEFQEKALMGLRLKEGIEIGQEEMEHVRLGNLNMLLENKFLEYDGQRYKTTLAGRLCLNTVLKMLVG